MKNVLSKTSQRKVDKAIQLAVKRDKTVYSKALSVKTGIRATFVRG